jgi:hypothetical protein
MARVMFRLEWDNIRWQTWENSASLDEPYWLAHEQ